MKPILQTIAIALIVGAARSQSPISASCNADSECASGFCFFFASGTGSGYCACNEATNQGCQPGESCLPLESSSEYPAVCTLDSGTPLPIDGRCANDGQCETGFCFWIPFIIPGSAGFCTCNINTNVGCTGDAMCMYPPGVADAGPECITLLPIGAECFLDEQCETRSCFFSEIGPSTCVCNAQNNAGCTAGQVCRADPEMACIGGSCPPFCVEADSQCRPWPSQLPGGRRFMF